MMIVWSLPGGDDHPILWPIFTKLYRARQLHGLRIGLVPQLYYFIQLAQGRKAEIAPVSTKMKPGARISRTIA
jgi:hypothetical protein